MADAMLTVTAGEARLPPYALELKGPHGATRVALSVRRLTVGQSADCDLACPDPSLSPVHAEVSLGPDGAVLKDLGSASGMFVAGVRVYEVQLKPGIELELGHSRLRLVAAEAAAVPLSKAKSFGDALGQSLAVRAMFAQLERVAKSDQSVLLIGEVGTGKDVLAKALHEASGRKGPFVAVACAKAKTLEPAKGGSLYLDGVGDLGGELQKRLLRTLDARLIASTPPTLKSRVEGGGFSAELYARFEAVVVPPLRDRAGDIPLLVESFLAQRQAADVPLEQLTAYSWPGNVRELKDAVSRFAPATDPTPAARGSNGVGRRSRRGPL